MEDKSKNLVGLIVVLALIVIGWIVFIISLVNMSYNYNENFFEGYMFYVVSGVAILISGIILHQLKSGYSDSDWANAKLYFTNALLLIIIVGVVGGGGYWIVTSIKNSNSDRHSYSSHSDGDGDQNDVNDNILNLSCDEILELVTNEGNLIEEADIYNSSALDYAACYEYDGMYFAIIEFTSSSEKYVYCDISQSYWNGFVDEGEQDSWGTAYNNWISGTSNCGSCER